MYESVRLRENIFHTMGQTSADLEAQQKASEYSLRKRLHELERSLNELEWQKKQVIGIWTLFFHFYFCKLLTLTQVISLNINQLGYVRDIHVPHKILYLFLYNSFLLSFDFWLGYSFKKSASGFLLLNHLLIELEEVFKPFFV